MSLDSEQTRDPKPVALIVALIMFMALLEGTVIATALPQMARDFGVAPSAMGISITSYLLVSATFLPASSWIAERFGARRVLTLSIAGFALASLLCGASTTLGFFILARMFQAFCSSLMMPVGNLVLLRVTPKRQLVQMMAISTTPALLAPVIGPPLGGFLTQAAGWPSIFFINIPLALIGIVMVRRLIPAFASTAPGFDLKGFVLVGGSLVCTIYAFDRIGAHPDGWASDLPLLIAGAIAGVAALFHLRRSPAPLVPLIALRHRSFTSVAFGAGFLMRLPFMGQALLLPLAFQLGFGFSPAGAGLLLLANNLGDLALKPFVGRVIRWCGFRAALTFGTAAMMLGIAATALLHPSWPFWLLLAAMAAIGMARSVAFTAMASLAFADVQSEELPGASVLSSIGNSLSAAIGISLSALFLNIAQQGQEPQLADYRLAILCLAGMGMLSIPLFARLPRTVGATVSGHKSREDRAREERESLFSP